VFALVGCNQNFHSNLSKHQASFHLNEEPAKQPPLSIHSQNLVPFQKGGQNCSKGAGIIHGHVFFFWTLNTESIAVCMAVRLRINAHSCGCWQVSDLAGAWEEPNTYTKSYELSALPKKVHISKTHSHIQEICSQKMSYLNWVLFLRTKW